jgi:hypothetical protein
VDVPHFGHAGEAAGHGFGALALDADEHDRPDRQIALIVLQHDREPQDLARGQQPLEPRAQRRTPHAEVAREVRDRPARVAAQRRDQPEIELVHAANLVEAPGQNGKPAAHSDHL